MEELKLRAILPEKAAAKYHNLKFLESTYLIDNRDEPVIETNITRFIGGWVLSEIQTVPGNVVLKDLLWIPMSDEHKPSEVNVDHDEALIAKCYGMLLNENLKIYDSEEYENTNEDIDLKIYITKVANGWIWREIQYFAPLNENDIEEGDDVDYQVEKKMLHIPYSDELIKKSEKNENKINEIDEKVEKADEPGENSDETGNTTDSEGSDPS